QRRPTVPRRQHTSIPPGRASLANAQRRPTVPRRQHQLVGKERPPVVDRSTKADGPPSATLGVLGHLQHAVLGRSTKADGPPSATPPRRCPRCSGSSPSLNEGRRSPVGNTPAGRSPSSAPRSALNEGRRSPVGNTRRSGERPRTRAAQRR